MEDFFGSMDRDFDGRLSFEEFMGEVAFLLFPLPMIWNQQESTIEKLFKNMDKNGDGVVTKEVS